MYIAVVGDGYRVGGLDDDNLYPDYSNVRTRSSHIPGLPRRSTHDIYSHGTCVAYRLHTLAICVEIPT